LFEWLKSALIGPKISNQKNKKGELSTNKIIESQIYQKKLIKLETIKTNRKIIFNAKIY